MSRKTKLSVAHHKLQGLFGSEVGFRFARMCKGVITHGQFWKRGDPLALMDAKTFDTLIDHGLIKESSTTIGCFYLK